MPEKNDKPNLEEIASQLAKTEEEYSLDQVLPAMYDSFISHSKQVDEKTGKVTYKTEFKSDEKEKIADDLFDRLSYHVHVNIYKMNIAEWKGLKGKKDPSGVSYTDSVVEKYFGIDRDGMRKTIDRQPELTPDIIGQIINESMQHHRAVIHKPMYDKLEEKHVPHIKEWIKEKAGKYDLDPKISEQIEDMQTIKEVKPIYERIAKAHYKKQQEASG